MPTLMPEFVQSLADSSRRAASLIEAEIQQARKFLTRAERQEELETALPAFRRRLARFASAKITEVAAEAEGLSEIWSSVVGRLRQLTADEQIAVLNDFLGVADSFYHHLDVAAEVSEFAVASGGDVDHLDVLAQVADRMARIRAEIGKAIEARTQPWHPADPERLERGRREAAEGRAVDPDEARAWFRDHSA